MFNKPLTVGMIGENVAALHQALTDSSVTLQQAYGVANNFTDTQLIELISNAKVFSRRVNISYEEVIEITRTKFINPHRDLIPKLQKLKILAVKLRQVKRVFWHLRKPFAMT
jgi:purine-nucleoside phosphorylase